LAAFGRPFFNSRQEQMMSEGYGCQKVRIAGCDGYRVMYCETHQVAELEIGALSLRLDIEAFSALHALLGEASQKINVIQSAKATQDGLMVRLRNG
jgi:hypothetical protein